VFILAMTSNDFTAETNEKEAPIMGDTCDQTTSSNTSEDMQSILNGLLRNAYRISAIFEIGKRCDIVNMNDVDELTVAKMAVESGHQASGQLLDLLESLNIALGLDGDLRV
jgi:hypothetical protein